MNPRIGAVALLLVLAVGLVGVLVWRSSGGPIEDLEDSSPGPENGESTALESREARRAGRSRDADVGELEVAMRSLCIADRAGRPVAGARVWPSDELESSLILVPRDEWERAPRSDERGRLRLPADVRVATVVAEGFAWTSYRLEEVGEGVEVLMLDPGVSAVLRAIDRDGAPVAGVSLGITVGDENPALGRRGAPFADGLVLLPGPRHPTRAGTSGADGVCRLEGVPAVPSTPGAFTGRDAADRWDFEDPDVPGARPWTVVLDPAFGVAFAFDDPAGRGVIDVREAYEGPRRQPWLSWELDVTSAKRLREAWPEARISLWRVESTRERARGAGRMRMELLLADGSVAVGEAVGVSIEEIEAPLRIGVPPSDGKGGGRLRLVLRRPDGTDEVGEVRLRGAWPDGDRFDTKVTLGETVALPAGRYEIGIGSDFEIIDPETGRRGYPRCEILPGRTTDLRYFLDGIWVKCRLERRGAVARGRWEWDARFEGSGTKVINPQDVIWLPPGRVEIGASDPDGQRVTRRYEIVDPGPGEHPARTLVFEPGS